MTAPTREEFLAAPRSAVAAVAPATLIYAPGGTRRRAALAGLDPQSDAYAEWSRQQMLRSFELFFGLGVQHLWVTVLRPAQLAEVGPYRERLLRWLAEGLAGEPALAAYAERGWRARLVGAGELPELAGAAARLAATGGAGPTVWYYVTADAAGPWRAALARLAAPRGPGESEVRALYGEEIPAATMLIGFGKPIIAADLLPPLLAGELQCYWSQRPGFEQDEGTIRRIFYDYAFTRRTWRQDKASRYRGLADDRRRWERSPALVLGLGERAPGEFWYPAEEEPL